MWSASRVLLRSSVTESIQVTNVLFADDVVLCCRSVASAQAILWDLDAALAFAGLSINALKSKWLRIPARYDAAGVPLRKNTQDESGEIQLRGEVLPQVEEFVFLGSLITTHSSGVQALLHRVQCAESCWHGWKPLLTCRRIPVDVRLHALFRGPFLSLVWLSETWTVNADILSRVKAWIHRKAGQVVGVKPPMTGEGGVDLNAFWRTLHSTGRDRLHNLGHCADEYVLRKAFTFAGHLARTDLPIIAHLLRRFSLRRWKLLQGTGDYLHSGRYRLEYWEKLCICAHPVEVERVPPRCNFDVDAPWGWVELAQDRTSWRQSIPSAVAKVLASL